MLTHYSSLSPAEVAEQIIKCGGLAPIFAMVSSEHDVMQNEALIALTIISSTVKGWICSSICLCVCVWCVEPEVQGCGSNCICEKKKRKNILVQYSHNFMHGFVKFLFRFVLLLIVMLFYRVLMWRQCNAMPWINLWEYWTTLKRIDCKTVGFFFKISKEIGNAWRKSLMHANRASLTHP